MAAQSAHAHPPGNPKGKDLWKLTIGALGVVYGDIGTSPLYAIKESFHPSHGLQLTDANIFGILSLVFWSLTLVVSFKYLAFILRADKQGEGGITTLIALLLPKLEASGEKRLKTFVVFLGLFGAGLLYGDGIITPAISVLSAVEGLEVATPAFTPFVVPITILILVVLFLIQKGGTSKIGAIFGPATLLWFFTLVATGLPWIFRRPEILQSFNPVYAVEFFINNGHAGFLTLASVVLCITGAEALYADMGHFGKKPIRLSWMLFVFPALIINYLGQGALILEKGVSVIDHTFYGLVSGWMVYPLVIIATLAAVIASQALISGAFSLTQHVVQLGYLPRTTIFHTSRETEGQIYVPNANYLLMVACIFLVIEFRASTNLASAYGIAVTSTMMITSILFFLVTRKIWHWKLLPALSLFLVFLVVDVAFFGANLVKFTHGGWIPVLIAVAILVVMLTWKKGRSILAQFTTKAAMPLPEFFHKISTEKPHRVKGTAIFMTLTQDIAPAVLLHHYLHNQILHEQVMLLSIVTQHQPEVHAATRVTVLPLEHGFAKVVARYGYMESPDVNEIFDKCEAQGLVLDRNNLSYYLGRESFVTTGQSEMSAWQKKLFVILSRNAHPATAFFNLPVDRVIEIGSQIKI